VVKNADGTLSRGDKLATLRTLLDRAGVLTHVALSASHGHDRAWGRPWLAEAPGLRAGDVLLAERGFLDGATVSDLKHRRRVAVIIPLKAKRLATQEAIALAEMVDQWHAHPARAAQTIALGRGGEQMWPACAVPLNACVIRYWNKKKKCIDHMVLVTTDLRLNAPGIVRHYEERPEIEQDYEQMQSGGGQLKKLRATRYSEIVFYVLTVVLSSSRYHLFANTQAGTRFADKTRQARAFEQLRTQRTHIIVYAGGSFAIFETLRFVQMVLQLSLPVQEHLRTWLAEHLNQIQKRE
jgi:hypothetical protein